MNDEIFHHILFCDSSGINILKRFRMSYISPSEIFKKFKIDESERNFQSLDNKTKALIINYQNLSTFDFNNISEHLLAPIIGEGKPHKQVTGCFPKKKCLHI